MIPPIITLRDLLREHGWGHLAAPIRPAPVLSVNLTTQITVRVESEGWTSWVYHDGRTVRGANRTWT